MIFKIRIEHFETGYHDSSPYHWFETDIGVKELEKTIIEIETTVKDGQKLKELQRRFKFLGQRDPTRTFTVNEDWIYLKKLKDKRK